MGCEVRRVRCEVVFSSFSTEIGEMKDEKTRMHEKARMHNVHPGSHPLSFSRLAGIASWLAGVSSWLAGGSSWLAGVSSWLAGVLPGWLEFLPGWLESLPGWLESQGVRREV